MAEGDVYQIVDRQELDGQTCLNVFYYICISDSFSESLSEGLALSFEADILPEIADVQSPAVTHTRLEVKNLFDDSDAYNNEISVPGEWANAEYHTDFDAVGFELEQQNGAVKNGAKRLAGVPEAVSVDGVLDDAGFLAALVGLGNFLVAQVESSGGSLFLPVIVKRILDGGDYRLPASVGELVYGVINDAVFNPRITSQVTRKVGTGE